MERTAPRSIGNHALMTVSGLNQDGLLCSFSGILFPQDPPGVAASLPGMPAPPSSFRIQVRSGCLSPTSSRRGTVFSVFLGDDKKLLLGFLQSVCKPGR